VALIHLVLLLSIVLCGTCGHVLAGETVVLKPYEREVLLTGLTRARSEMTISSEVSGSCLQVFVDKGDSVGADGRVVRLDDTFVSIELDKNKIAREQMERRLQLQNKTVERYTTLIRNRSTPLATLEEASLQAEIYRLSLETLKNDEMRLNELQVRHTIRGPAGWRVIERLVEPGEYVNQGQPVIRLGDYAALVVPVLLTYEELTLLNLEPQPMLYFPELKKQAEAVVYRVAPGFAESSRKISADLLVDAKPEVFPGGGRGGLLVHLKLKKKDGEIFVVPSRSLVNRFEAYWLETPGHERVRVVLLGKIHDGADSLVSGEGLAAGEQYLATPGDGSGGSSQYSQ
jgi:multidrug efflux pump subunit AcrA (membrane-fusion protein)